MLKIILIGFTPIIAMVQMLLDHKWHDRRTKKHKIVLRTLIVAMVLSSFGAVRVEIADKREVEAQKREVEAQQREIRAKMLQHINLEFAWNFAQIQDKGGGTYGLITNPPPTSDALHFQLSLLTAGGFLKDVPKIWTPDLKLLMISHTANDRAAAQAVFNMYDSIDRTEQDEARLIDAIGKAKDRKERDEAVRMLHFRYEELRSNFVKNARTLAPLISTLQQGSSAKH